MYRYRFLISALTITALTILLTVASSPAQAAPRSIPWDCSDWQETPAVADADDARVSMILESLAANRGKAIYCAIDQSDTWTKTETWEAGRDRNERDDTVYFGEQGNFRGFLAAQEGYLTDGESGVTGVSRELIFEFPEEPRRGKKTVIKRLNVPVDDRNCYPLDGAGATQTFDDGVVVTFDRNPVYTNGPEYVADCRRTIAAWGNTAVNWDIIPGSVGRNESNQWPRRSRQRAVNQNNLIANTDWDALSQTAATAYCQSLGYPRAVNVVATDPPPAGGSDGGASLAGRDNDYWVYLRELPTQAAQRGAAKHRAAPVNTWSATCTKKVRVRRR